MDARVVNPFISALSTVLPQLGFKNIARGKVQMQAESIDCLGVAVNVGVTSQTPGSVVFNMTEATAKSLTSVMMMGATVNQLDDMAQSAICEMVNMITSNAATALSKEGIAIKLAPPALCQSTSKVKVCSSFINIEMVADNLTFELCVGIN